MILAILRCFDIVLLILNRRNRRRASVKTIEESKNRRLSSQAQRRVSNMIDIELKRSNKIEKSTIKILILGTGESGKSTVLKQLHIIHTSTFNNDEKRSQIVDIKQNIGEAVWSILSNMDELNYRLASDDLSRLKKYALDNVHLLKLQSQTSSRYQEESGVQLWNAIERLWKCQEVKQCAKKGNLFNLIDNAEYFLDRVGLIRRADYLPSEQDILRCRSVTTGVMETYFTLKKINFRVFDVGGQRDQRRKWIQCFNQVTAIVFVADVSWLVNEYSILNMVNKQKQKLTNEKKQLYLFMSYKCLYGVKSFNMTLRENKSVNRLKESLESFRQIWNNRYLNHISIILFFNKYDLLVKKLVEDGCKLEHYFPEFESYELPAKIDKHLIVNDEDVRVTRAKLFIRDKFMEITCGHFLDRNKLQPDDVSKLNKTVRRTKVTRLFLKRSRIMFLL